MGIGVKIAQTLLFAFNFVFVLIGLAAVIIGAVVKVKYDDYEELTSRDIGGASVLLLVLGGIIFIVSFFGCCGAIRKSVVMLTIFIGLLVILLIVEIAGIATAYIFKSELKGYIEDGMDHAIENYDKTKYKDAMDTVQKEFECCGAENATDYLHANQSIPQSCCGDLKGNATCTLKLASSREGCVDELYDYLEDHLAIIGGVAVAIVVIQIVGIVFACLVRRDVKEGYGYV